MAQKKNTLSSTALPTIQRTCLGDRFRCLATFTEAFRADPAARWLFPESDSYGEAFTEFAEAFTGPAFANNTAFHTPGFKGASAWFAPHVHDNEEAVIAAIERHVPLEIQPDAFRVFEQMDSFHPEHPHWYLPLIGVHPLSRDKGLGTRLLRHVLRECDHTGHDAYLESSNAANLSLYKRHGFQLIGEIQAGSSPTLYPMLRKSQ